MNEGQKQLLIKDLCARLPYGIKCKGFVYDNEGNKIERINTIECIIPQKGLYKYTETDAYHNISRIKPYLRPMSSMTEEEDKEWQYYKNAIVESCDEKLGYKIGALHSWFNSHHFDYRGLIPMGLALKALKDMYKTN